MSKLKFGFYPRSLEFSAGSISIQDAPDLQEIADEVVRGPGVHRDWIYAPPQEEIRFGNQHGTYKLPFPSRVFSLPKTHSIELRGEESEERLTHHLWCLSFFTGMRLTATQAGFVDATPLKPAALVDFHVLDSTLPFLMESADAFWNTNIQRPSRAKRLAGIIHTLFLSQCPCNLHFEIFTYLYTALDACFSLVSDMHGVSHHIGHSKKIQTVCEILSVRVPKWAEKFDGLSPEVVALRNHTIHDALFMGEPLGFAVYQEHMTPNITVEMQALICRIMIALIAGLQLSYVASPTDSRQNHILRLDRNRQF